MPPDDITLVSCPNSRDHRTECLIVVTLLNVPRVYTEAGPKSFHNFKLMLPGIEFNRKRRFGMNMLISAPKVIFRPL
jgi:hypothetical protein